MNKRILAGIMTVVISAMGMLSTVNAAEKFEGDGADTAIEAAQAYMDAFAKNDLDGMIKTFAIESFAESFNLEDFMESSHAWYQDIPVPYQLNNDYAVELAALQHLGYLQKLYTNQYLYYSMLARGESYDGSKISFSDKTAEEVLQENFGTPIWIENEITDIQILTPEEFENLDERYFGEHIQNSIKIQKQRLGIEESQSLIAVFHVGGLNGYQFLDAGKYGDKWYIITPQSTIAMMYGLNTHLGGLVIGVDFE